MVHILYHLDPFLSVSFACSNSSILLGLFFCQEPWKGRLVRWPTALLVLRMILLAWWHTSAACLKVTRDSTFSSSPSPILDSLYSHLEFPLIWWLTWWSGPGLHYQGVWTLGNVFCDSCKYSFTSKLGKTVPRPTQVNLMDAKCLLPHYSITEALSPAESVHWSDERSCGILVRDQTLCKPSCSLENNIAPQIVVLTEAVTKDYVSSLGQNRCPFQGGEVHDSQLAVKWFLKRWCQIREQTPCWFLLLGAQTFSGDGN